MLNFIVNGLLSVTHEGAFMHIVWRAWRCRVGLRLGYRIGSMLNLIVNGLLGSTHEGAFMCIVPIDLTQLAWLVCAQQSITSRRVWLLRFLGWPVFPGIVGRVWLLTASLQLIVAFVQASFIFGLPLLVIGGWLVRTVLL